MQPLRGIILKLIAVFVFIVMSSLIKAVSDTIPIGETVFFRSFFAIPVLVGWLAMRHELHTGFRVKSPTMHVLRGCLGCMAMGCSFGALGFLPLPEATALGYAMPLLVVVFAAMFLNEKVGIYRFGAVGVGLIGVLVVMAPRLTIGAGDAMETAQVIGVTLALFGATCGALSQIHIRNMIRTEQTSAIVFWFFITSTVLSMMTIPFGWVMPRGWDWVWLISIGLLGGVGQICVTSSYRHADASLIAPFDYASMLFAVFIGYFFFAEVPTVQTIAGAGIVISAGVFIILRERRLGLQRGEARRAKTPHG